MPQLSQLPSLRESSRNMFSKVKGTLKLCWPRVSSCKDTKRGHGNGVRKVRGSAASKPSTPLHAHFSFHLLCGQVLCKPAQAHCSPATPTRALLGLASQGDCTGPEPVPPRQCPPYNYSEGRPAAGAALTPGSWPLTQNLGPAQVWSSRQRGREMLRGMGGKGRQRASVALRHRHFSAVQKAQSTFQQWVGLKFPDDWSLSTLETLLEE